MKTIGQIIESFAQLIGGVLLIAVVWAIVAAVLHI
jgi:hypothetical protein